MRLPLLSLFASLAYGFKDTSPFFYLSTSALPAPFSSHNLAAASSIQSTLLATLSSCPSTTYIVVNQSGVSISDYTTRGAAPHLRHLLVNGTDSLKTRHAISEVRGEIDLDIVVDTILRKCSASSAHADTSTGEIPTLSKNPTVVPIQFDSPPHSQKERLETLSNHDSFIHAILSTLPAGQSYTVIYATSPPDAILRPPIYNVDDEFESPLHIELKRDGLVRPVAKGNGTVDGPLFEKYTFLSPALFMGLLVTLPLLLLLYVALSALSSLKVSYFAFSKEMGPAAQKKGQ